ncbi:cilia- and flagella-associated protein HOATZ-like isoform X1 [Xenopus laevis]|uniref:Cilia- and flagella-associated protein HOATZ n=1 Tax=Xenopus laevis TaxID=8355 RepID=A0A8J0TC22_XENLA|nr:cilia- and flagella-associated protein HOATZ-like isoform X1 [Xenopus laevis]
MEDSWAGDCAYTVFSGSCERDVSLCKIFWNSVTLQPPLESRLVSGDIEQRLRAAGSTKQNKNITHQQSVENPKMEYFLFEAQQKQYLKEKANYLNKANKREEIIELLKKQREERIKKEEISQAYKPQITEKRSRSDSSGCDAEVLEEIRAVQRLQ